jgi:hypothetical protein
MSTPIAHTGLPHLLQISFRRPIKTPQKRAAKPTPQGIMRCIDAKN